MKLVTAIVAAVCCAAMSGCVVHDHRHGRPHATKAKVVVPVPVVVETHTHAPAKHCPPGQAKKGKC